MNPRLRLCVWPCLTSCLLAVSAATALAATGAATLRWISPGDDGLIGRAFAYDIRYSLAPITAANFNPTAPGAGIPTPQYPGELEVFKVTNLVVGTGYYFAIKTVDEAQNWSAISNIGSYFVGATADVITPPTLSLCRHGRTPPAGRYTGLTLLLMPDKWRSRRSGSRAGASARSRMRGRTPARAK